MKKLINIVQETKRNVQMFRLSRVVEKWEFYAMGGGGWGGNMCMRRYEVTSAQSIHIGTQNFFDVGRFLWCIVTINSDVIYYPFEV